jgi:hypothetical protein
MIPDRYTNLAILHGRLGDESFGLDYYFPLSFLYVFAAVVERHALVLALDEWKTASCRGTVYWGFGVLYTGRQCKFTCSFNELIQDPPCLG